MFTLGGVFAAALCLRGEGTPDGGRTEFPGFICSFFSFICFRNTWGQGVELSFLPIGKYKCLSPSSPGDYRQLNISYLEPTGRGGFTAGGGLSFERCRQTSRRLSDYQEYYDRYLSSNSTPLVLHLAIMHYYAIMQKWFLHQKHTKRLPYTYDETALALTERPPYPDYSLKVGWQPFHLKKNHSQSHLKLFTS